MFQKKFSKWSYAASLAIVFVAGMCVAARAASVGGAVANSQGQSVSGVQIIAKDAQGHVIGQGSTGNSGIYDIKGLQPGNYNFTLDPGSSGFLGQTVASYVGPDGICLNWGVSNTSPAVATAQPGATCQPIAGWWGDTAVAVGAGAAVLAGGGIGAAIAFSGGGSPEHKSPTSTGQ
jgi:hypothetical protein